MTKKDIDLLPIAGSILLILLYAVSLKTRGFFLPEEYDFALQLKHQFPAISGEYMPKVPAMLATLISAALLWLTAVKLRLHSPGTAAGCYLCFPPIWWLGTSALPSAVQALFISVAAFALFISRKEKKTGAKLGFFAVGLLGAAGAAWLAKVGYFDWIGIIMAFMPLFFLLGAIRLEKLDDRGLANNKLNRIAVSAAVLCGLLLVFFLLPSFARILNVDFPAALTVFPRGKSIWPAAVSLLIPLLWIYILLKAKSYPEKLFIFCLAAGFTLLTLPPALPWQRLSLTLQPDQIRSAAAHCSKSNTVFFADNSTAAAFSYVLKVPVRTAGRSKNDLPPAELPEAVRSALTEKNVIVVSYNGELDTFLPPDKDCVRFTLQKCKIFRFAGEKVSK